MKTVLISLQIFFLIGGCTMLPKQKIKESHTSLSCRSADLSPVMVCGDYVIVKGKLNNSNNLERINKGTIYLSEYLNKNENRDLIDKNILLSGKCRSELIMGIPKPNEMSGRLSAMIYLTDAKLIEEKNIFSVCKELKGN
jgi:hypothetical protein